MKKLESLRYCTFVLLGVVFHPLNSMGQSHLSGRTSDQAKAAMAASKAQFEQRMAEHRAQQQQMAAKNLQAQQQRQQNAVKPFNTLPSSSLDDGIRHMNATGGGSRHPIGSTASGPAQTRRQLSESVPVMPAGGGVENTSSNQSPSSDSASQEEARRAQEAVLARKRAEEQTNGLIGGLMSENVASFKNGVVTDKSVAEIIGNGNRLASEAFESMVGSPASTQGGPPSLGGGGFQGFNPGVGLAGGVPMGIPPQTDGVTFVTDDGEVRSQGYTGGQQAYIDSYIRSREQAGSPLPADFFAQDPNIIRYDSVGNPIDKDGFVVEYPSEAHRQAAIIESRSEALNRSVFGNTPDARNKPWTAPKKELIMTPWLEKHFNEVADDVMDSQSRLGWRVQTRDEIIEFLKQDRLSKR